MPAALTSYDSFFSRLGGEDAGAGQEYDLAGDAAPAPEYDTGNDTAPTPEPETAPAATPAPAQQPAAQPSQAPAAGFASPLQPPAQGPTSTKVETGAFAAPKTSNALNTSLFSGIAKQLWDSSAKLQQAATGFSSQVSPFRTFEGIGAEEQLSGAYRQGATGEQKGAARGLLSAKYAGPSGLDQKTLDEIQATFADTQPRAASLRTAAGAQDLLRGTVPALSSGQRKFESKRLLKDQDYRQGAQAIEQGSQNLLQDFYRSQQEAKAIASQRESEESDIAKRSGEFLTGKGEDISKAVNPRVADATAKQQALSEAFTEWNRTGSEDALQKLNSLGANVNAGDLFTEAGRLDAEGDAIRQGIMEKPEYAAIKDAPTNILRINRHGRETLDLDPGWWRENKKNFPKGKDKYHPEKLNRKEMRALVRKRNLELEKAGFSPGSMVAKNQNSERYAESLAPGKYSTFDPLYFSDQAGFDPADPRNSLAFDDATMADRGNQATEDERSQYNAIQELLGGADRIESTAPYHGASVTGDTGAYRTAQEKELADRKVALEDAVRKERKAVKNARRMVHKNKNSKSLRTVVDVLGGLSSMGMSQIWGPSVRTTLRDVSGVGNVKKVTKKVSKNPKAKEDEVK